MSARKKSGSSQPSAPLHNGPIAGIYEGDFGMIELEADPYTGNGWLISINGVPSSHIDLDEPRQLAFEYMRWIATAVEAHIRDHGELNPAKLRITHLGGGACTMARYFADVYPESRNSVVELDGELAKLARQWFDIPRAPRVKIRIDDARDVATAFTPESRDVIIRDVFAGAVTPKSFTTVEFFKDCQRGLAPEGSMWRTAAIMQTSREQKQSSLAWQTCGSIVRSLQIPPCLKGAVTEISS